MHRTGRRLAGDWPAFHRTAALPFLRGCGQMLFQPSAVTGSVFLLLIASQSLPALGLCLAGALGATLCAYRLERSRRAYYRGLGGFNGALLGLALGAFYELNGLVLLAALAGGLLTTWVRAVLARLLPVPPFTAPFVAVAWLAFAVLGLAGAPAAPPAALEAGWLHTPVNNASQVLFLQQLWVGALVLAAVFLHSRRAGLWVGAASLIAWAAALALGLPDGPTAAGLLGYNALILAAALKHRHTFIPLAAAGAVATVGLTGLFLGLGITPLSAPFVLTAWLVIGAEAAGARWGRPRRG